MKLTVREKLALKDAVEHPEGWGLFNPKTTAALAARGYFAKQKHQSYGMQWRITEAGREAYSEASQ
ncbi:MULTISPECIES: hypothetical protein [unclassified Bradyrhizobium]|uniref:hypothetical protein n=1 Tax=unclassified Bradyrhizobium TaxID=2631580 RepID=UPI0029167EB3|nr:MULTISPECIES: hypothetical protein [unclassified Bradyrhizobium]